MSQALKAVVAVVLLAFLAGYVAFAPKTWTIFARNERYEGLPGTTLLLLRDGELVDRLVTDASGVAEFALGRSPWKHRWGVIACRPGWYATRIIAPVGRRGRVGDDGLASTWTDATNEVLLFPRLMPGPDVSFRAYAAQLPEECVR